MSSTVFSSGPLVTPSYYPSRNPYQSTYNVTISRNVHSRMKKKAKLIVLANVAMVFVLVSACMAATAVVLTQYTYAVQEGTFSGADTRLYPISTFFCDSLQLYVDSDTAASPTDALGAMVYITNEPPPLDINASFTSKYDYNTVALYLHPSSTISLQSCMTTNSTDDFILYIIKGTKNFISWENDPFYGWDEEYVVGSKCPTMSEFDYWIQDEDTYYIAKYCSVQDDSCEGEMILSVNRYEYNVSFVLSNPSCFTNYYQEACDIDVPFASDYSQALVVTQLASPESMFEPIHQANVQLICNPRVPFYIAMTLVPILLMIFVMVVIFVVYWSCWRRRHVDHKHYPPLLSANQQTISSASSEEYRPPPYNPEYNSN